MAFNFDFLAAYETFLVHAPFVLENERGIQADQLTVRSISPSPFHWKRLLCYCEVGDDSSSVQDGQLILRILDTFGA